MCTDSDPDANMTASDWDDCTTMMKEQELRDAEEAWAQSNLRIPEREIPDIFVWAAKHGHMAVLEWLRPSPLLVKYSQRDPSVYMCDRLLDWMDHAKNRAFEEAAHKGHIAVLEWLMKHFTVKLEDVSIYDKTVLLIAVKGNHLGVIKWLVEHLEFTQGCPDTELNIKEALMLSTELGRVYILDWLLETFPWLTTIITKQDLSVMTSDAIRHNHMDVLRWLDRHFEVSSGKQARKAVAYDNTTVLSWLEDTGNLQGCVTYGDNCLTRSAVRRGKLNSLKWLLNKFPPTAAQAVALAKSAHDIHNPSEEVVKVREFLDARYGVRVKSQCSVERATPNYKALVKAHFNIV